MTSAPRGAASRRGFLQGAATALAAPALLPAQTPASTPAKPKGEVRGVWLHPERSYSANPEEGKKQIRTTVERLAKANFNLILPWITSDYLAGFDSPEYAATHPTAKWDSLGVLIEEAAQHGLGVDIWYSYTDYRTAASPEFNPKVGGNPEWAAHRLDELVADPKTGKTVAPPMDNVCPMHWQARRWQQAQIRKTLDRYPKLRGFHIEEPGYGVRTYCVCELCRTTFEKLHGQKLTDVMESYIAEDFRTLGNTAFFEELRAEFQTRYPKLVLSANGGFDWMHDRKRGREWGRWARAGWLQYYASQVYVTDTAKFKQQFGKTMADIGANCPIYAGLAIDWSEGKNTLPEFVSQITAAQRMGAPGIALFHYAAFTDEVLAALKKGPFNKQVPLS